MKTEIVQSLFIMRSSGTILGGLSTGLVSDGLFSGVHHNKCFRNYNYSNTMIIKYMFLAV
ncbi:MAG TPA: hypothetical protein PLG33_03035 [Prolixibacteraceae bacterium]|nr:hypothetical protein [Prolixibacteraceae bacterium]HPR84998.1 hypothetical protein [Prolixibacteraceae bacterium]